jgi:hypothetical protein
MTWLFFETKFYNMSRVVILFLAWKNELNIQCLAHIADESYKKLQVSLRRQDVTFDCRAQTNQPDVVL